MRKSIETGTILDDIIAYKRNEIAHQKAAKPQDALIDEALNAPPPRDFVGVLRAPGISLIAETKKASPSKGLLRPNYDPVVLARIYESNGASAISVLTDAHFFHGHLDDLRNIRQAVRQPVLRKDFIIDLYQVYEARAAGADALLLILAVLDDATLHNLYALTRHLGMAALLEVHNANDLERALALHPRLIGINNRDLHTFNVSLDITATLRRQIPGRITVVAESGIHSAGDVARLAAMDIDAMLVGEALVTAHDVAGKLRELISVK